MGNLVIVRPAHSRAVLGNLALWERRGVIIEIMNSERIDLEHLVRARQQGAKFAMLTAYDYPTAAMAQAAGVESLLVGDSMGTVLLGHSSTRAVSLELMLTLAEAVRRGAPRVFLVGDLPFESAQGGPQRLESDALRFRDESGCDAVKIEVDPNAVEAIERLANRGVTVIAHLGLRPQSVLTPDGYRAQARDAAGVQDLVADARRMVDAGAAMLLLEAVPAEAARAVVEATPVPVIGCGAGPHCHGHVVVTYDMLGISSIPAPRFVPVLAQLGEAMQAAMERYVQDIHAGRYPAAEHGYSMREGPTSRSQV